MASAGCILVPTMGALHEGHAELIRRGSELAKARGYSGGCVVSIFVNPTQFNEAADYQRYPRTLEEDARICERCGASVIFAPEVGEVYPAGREIPVPPLPMVAERPRLEDAARPGHFAGVCQVVLRLFQLVRPRASIFGEKDWQQLQVVRAMTRQQNLPIEIIGAPTVREPDGLAMSSRNRFLSAEDRRRGLALSRALKAAGHETTPDAGEGAMREVLAAEDITPDYAVVRDAETLEPGAPSRVTGPGRPMRAVIAARVGTVRLLDNMAWPAV